MSKTDLPTLRILLAGLPEADVARLNTFVRIRSDRLTREWQIVNCAPIDLYIHDVDDAPTIPGQLDQQPTQIGVASAGGDDAGSMDRLLRPLQYEAFVDRLVLIEQRAASGAAPNATRPSARPAAPGAVRATLQHDRARFRLRRWPRPDLMQPHRYGLRMASFLTSRALSVDELATLSGATPQECETFIQTLGQSGLLINGGTEDRPGPDGNLPQEKGAPSRETTPRPTRSLLANLRSRLGIPKG